MPYLRGYAIKFILTLRVAWLVALFSLFLQGEVQITSVFHDVVLLIALVCALIGMSASSALGPVSAAATL